MSIPAFNWVWSDVKGINATARVILLCLADLANDDDLTWRSRAVIAERADCSLSTLERQLKALEEYGLISRYPRYTWCTGWRKDNEPCTQRGAHKHRVGTIYHVHTELGKFDAKSAATRLLREENPLEEETVESTNIILADMEIVAAYQQETHIPHIEVCDGTVYPQQHSQPSPVKMTDEDISPESDQETHIHQNDGQGSVTATTNVKKGLPHPSPVRGIRLIDPPITPQPNLTLPKPGPQQGADSVRSGRGDHELTTGERAALAECLPEGIGGLDAAGSKKLAQALICRLSAGWKPSEIRQQLAAPLPPTVHRLASLLLARLESNVVPDQAPALRRAERERIAQARHAQLTADDQAQEAPKDPEWDALVAQLAKQHPDFTQGQVCARATRILHDRRQSA